MHLRYSQRLFLILIPKTILASTIKIKYLSNIIFKCNKLIFVTHLNIFIRSNYDYLIEIVKIEKYFKYFPIFFGG